MDVPSPEPPAVPLEVRRSFEGAPPDIADCRRLVAAAVIEAGLDGTDLNDIAQLAVTELVTNAIEHAGGPVEVLIRIGVGVHLAVHDTSPVLPELQMVPWTAERGRGLRLVDAVSEHWGAAPDADGKWMWCELALRGLNGSGRGSRPG